MGAGLYSNLFLYPVKISACVNSSQTLDDLVEVLAQSSKLYLPDGFQAVLERAPLVDSDDGDVIDFLELVDELAYRFLVRGAAGVVE